MVRGSLTEGCRYRRAEHLGERFVPLAFGEGVDLLHVGRRLPPLLADGPNGHRQDSGDGGAAKIAARHVDPYDVKTIVHADKGVLAAGQMPPSEYIHRPQLLTVPASDDGRRSARGEPAALLPHGGATTPCGDDVNRTHTSLPFLLVACGREREMMRSPH